MANYHTNKRKIINDPVHGFIGVTSDLLFDLISHPYFQRLRRIKQLGMTHLVYPGATHTRFQHAIGAMHLMQMAINIIRSKNHEITDLEEEGALVAILLHDIGHGPFSHTLESTIISGVSHEEMSLHLMHDLNLQFHGRLSLAIDIFNGSYRKKFLHQLVAGQLDMDRMDYLKRDSFYTGVTEGVIGSDRIIKMLNVQQDQLVVESKGIYSVEKFLIARRLMYWQVYFHKTVVAAENLLMMLLRRARELVQQGDKLFASPSLNFFLERTLTSSESGGCKSVSCLPDIVSNFIRLDDDDIMSAAKVWADHHDMCLSLLARMFTDRSLPRIVITDRPVTNDVLQGLKDMVKVKYGVPSDQAGFFVFQGGISNYAYSAEDEKIRILYNNGVEAEITEASDILNISVLSKKVKKYFLCYPKNIPADGIMLTIKL